MIIEIKNIKNFKQANRKNIADVANYLLNRKLNKLSAVLKYDNDKYIIITSEENLKEVDKTKDQVVNTVNLFNEKVELIPEENIFIKLMEHANQYERTYLSALKKLASKKVWLNNGGMFDKVLMIDFITEEKVEVKESEYVDIDEEFVEILRWTLEYGIRNSKYDFNPYSMSKNLFKGKLNKVKKSTKKIIVDHYNNIMSMQEKTADDIKQCEEIANKILKYKDEKNVQIDIALYVIAKHKCSKKQEESLLATYEWIKQQDFYVNEVPDDAPDIPPNVISNNKFTSFIKQCEEVSIQPASNNSIYNMPSMPIQNIPQIECQKLSDTRDHIRIKEVKEPVYINDYYNDEGYNEELSDEDIINRDIANVFGVEFI